MEFQVKNIINVLIVAVLTSVSLSASAGTSGNVELFFQPSSSAAYPSGSLFLAHHFDKAGLGVSAFTLVTEGWAEAYVGPTWAPTDWLELGLAVGFEQAGSKTGLRFESSLWAGYKGFSFLGIVEFNPDSFKGNDSGVWFDLTPKYQALPWLSIGAKYRRPVGVGPLVEFSIPTTPSVAVWLNWAPIDPEKGDGDLVHLTRFLVGVQAKF